MHKLNRPNAPGCLQKYQHGRDRWSDLSAADKEEIWNKLDEMQLQRCAYCEDSLENGRHIEHFQQRAHAPRLTFDWNNLFGSCNKVFCCGKYKDKQIYNSNDLIKPDVDDPEEFLRFLSDGSVVPKSGLGNGALHKAQETIRVFNLESLRFIRYRHIAGYIQTAEEYAQMAQEFDEEEWRPLFDEELSRIQNLPFATAIRHVLIGFIDG